MSTCPTVLRSRSLALSLLSAALLSACGGNVATPAQTSTPAQADAPLKVQAATDSSTVVVRAKATLASNAGPQMQLRVNDVVVGSTEVRSASYADYAFSTAPVPAEARVDVVFDNDKYENGEDRNLFVESITVGGVLIAANAPGVSFDRGNGAGAFDGVDVLPGLSTLYWNGALRFTIAGATAPATGQAQATIIAGTKQNIGYPVGLDGSQSKGTNPFGQVDTYGVKNYAWSFGDGTPDRASDYLTTVTHAFAASGKYTVRLTVTDYAGGRASTSSVIDVGTLPRQPAPGGDITAAIAALTGQPGIVAVPAGTFAPGVVSVPAGVIIEGAGADRTKLTGVTFLIRGDNVRITGIEADGEGKSDDNLFSNYGNKNLLVDHSDWHHYVQATSIAEYASATLEDNFIHDHDYAGMGYGIELAGGGWAMIRRNRFERNRHSVAAGGKSGSTASEYVSMSTGYDLIDNSISVDAVNRDVTIDMHPTGHGRVRIVGNRFENVGYGIGLFDGWGEIRDNTFTDVSGYVILSRRPVHNGNFIASAGVYRLDIAGNTFIRCRNHYQIEYGTNITIEGKPVAPPYIADVPPP